MTPEGIYIYSWLVVDLPLWKIMEFVSWGYYPEIRIQSWPRRQTDLARWGHRFLWFILSCLSKPVVNQSCADQGQVSYPIRSPSQHLPIFGWDVEEPLPLARWFQWFQWFQGEQHLKGRTNSPVEQCQKALEKSEKKRLVKGHSHNGLWHLWSSPIA